ncbi:hypothetical protein B0T25DRAFT_530654 [Lasiosphaeria hispida]|uniref:Uncharacterized protein n=1 Tax=Lasiosphaeria hispida TaxID=260671 RepID=A0AAJ0HXC1_9PEZI|nr:hypothetical protein B0T25DRAFT_530654 [Lasiosphaeria hispida]
MTRPLQRMLPASIFLTSLFLLCVLVKPPSPPSPPSPSSEEDRPSPMGPRRRIMVREELKTSPSYVGPVGEQEVLAVAWKKEKGELESARDGLMRIVREQKSELEEANQKLGIAETALKTLEGVNRDLEKEKERLEHENKALVMDKEFLEAEASELRVENVGLEGEKLALERANRALEKTARTPMVVAEKPQLRVEWASWNALGINSQRH